ncbi:MAG: carboxypeptidase regulatory-like domain-containing protein, partial [Flavobacteriaceae bacterium]|nr:carboxypeptidase regulatory-like domain-containing protein [Flavobacteriaceae bacterium]
SNAEWLISGNVFRFKLNLTTTAFFNAFSDAFISSRISTSVKLPHGIVFVPQLTYEYSGNGLTSVQGQLKKQLFEKAHLQVSYLRNFNYDQFYLQLGFTYELPFSRVGLFSSTNKNQTSFSQSATGSLTFDPRASYLKFNNTPDLGRGDLKFQPFLDLNGNQKRDKNEPLVEGLSIRNIGGGIREKAKDGTIIFSGLEPYIMHHFILNTTNLNRISWRVEKETYNISVNPNQLKLIEIPVSVVGEVAGFIYDSKNGIGGIKINIFNEKEELVVSILSESDGYFSFLGLKSGGYSAKIDSLQLQKLQMWTEHANSTFVIDNGTDGVIVDNIEFVLYKGEIEKPIAETIHEGYQSEKANFILSEKASDKNKSNEKASEQLVYSVQLLASKRRVELSDPFFKGLEDVEEYLHEGIHKYTTGASKSVKEANKIKNKLLSRGFHGAFVVS